MPTTTEPVRNLIGANMSVRRDVFDAVGGFRTGIGRVGTRPLGCEETELCIRARRMLPGSEFIFSPKRSTAARSSTLNVKRPETSKVAATTADANRSPR